jgi:hypothetical protein
MYRLERPCLSENNEYVLHRIEQQPDESWLSARTATCRRPVELKVLPSNLIIEVVRGDLKPPSPQIFWKIPSFEARSYYNSILSIETMVVPPAVPAVTLIVGPSTSATVPTIAIAPRNIASLIPAATVPMIVIAEAA